MDYFNGIMKYSGIFENQETIDELKNITDEIRSMML